MALTKPVTVEDLVAADDGYRYDLIRGELFRMSPAGDDHSAVAGRFVGYLAMVVLPGRLGNLYVAEPGFVLRRNPDTLVAPDVAFVRTERLAPDRDRRKFLQIVPDLAVEVISPSDSARLVAEKLAAYRQAGTPLLVVIYPGPREVVIHRAGQAPVVLRVGDVLDAGDIVPGFRLPIRDLFG